MDKLVNGIRSMDGNRTRSEPDQDAGQVQKASPDGNRDQIPGAVSQLHRNGNRWIDNFKIKTL
jgi:hypothetical protein